MPRRKPVDAWFTRYENPMKPVVMAIRDVILAADPRVDECIKWSAPTFVYQGNLASFFPRSKQHASLMFHQGSKIPGKHPRLEGSGIGRTMKIGSLAEVAKAKRELTAIVRAWCDLRDAATAKPKAKTKTKTKTKTKAKAKAKAKPAR